MCSSRVLGQDGRTTWLVPALPALPTLPILETLETLETLPTNPPALSIPDTTPPCLRQAVVVVVVGFPALRGICWLRSPTCLEAGGKGLLLEGGSVVGEEHLLEGTGSRHHVCGDGD